MFQLTIKNADGSIYWVEPSFKTKEDGEKWLNGEKQKDYFPKDHTVEWEDKTPSKAHVAAQVKRKKDFDDGKKSALKKLKDLGLTKDELEALFGTTD